MLGQLSSAQVEATVAVEGRNNKKVSEQALHGMAQTAAVCCTQARSTIGALPADIAVPPTPFRPQSGVTPGAWTAEAPSKFRSPDLRVGRDPPANDLQPCKLPSGYNSDDKGRGRVKIRPVSGFGFGLGPGQGCMLYRQLPAVWPVPVAVLTLTAVLHGLRWSARATHWSVKRCR